eukprot:IDg11967t1
MTAASETSESVSASGHSSSGASFSGGRGRRDGYRRNGGRKGRNRRELSSKASRLPAAPKVVHEAPASPPLLLPSGLPLPKMPAGGFNPPPAHEIGKHDICAPPYHVLDVWGDRGLFLMPGHIPVGSLAEIGLVLPMFWMHPASSHSLNNRM